MKKLSRLLIVSIALMIIGGVIILVAYMSKKDELETLNARFGSTIYEIDEQVTGLNVNATDGSIYVLYGDSARVTIDDCCLDRISVSVENGVLKIEQKFPETVSVAGWELPAYIVGCSSEHRDAITITLPENKTIGKAEICMGKGDVKINGLNAHDLQVQVGLGSFVSNPIRNLTHYVYQVPFGTVDFKGVADNN